MAYEVRSGLHLQLYTVYCVASRVLTIIPIMETPTKDMDMMETIWAGVLLSECSTRSHSHFWCWENLPVPKSSSVSFVN